MKVSSLFLISGVLFFNISLLFSQSSSDWDKVASLYESEKPFQWVRKWQGMLHEVHDIEVVLASQNHVVKGWLMYQKSRDTLFLEGDFDGEQFRLLESSKTGDFTGTIELTLKGNDLEGEYSNKRNSYSWSLFLSEQSEGLSFSSVKNLFFLRQYRNWEEGSELDLILTARNQNTISGILYFVNKSIALDCKGQKVNNYEYTIHLTDFAGKSCGTAHLSTLPGNQKLIFYPHSAEPMVVPISMYSELTLEWLKYSSYESMIEVSFPKVANEYFNDYAGKITSEWFESLTHLCKAEGVKQEFDEGDWRNAVLGSSWFEPYYLSKTLVSGCFIMTDNRTSKKFSYIPVTFSLEKNRDIDVWYEFKNEKRIEEIILAERKKLLREKGSEYNELFNDWLAGQEFRNLVVTNGGIVAISEYDIRFGLQKIFLPAEVLKKEIKSFSMLRKFVI